MVTSFQKLYLIQKAMTEFRQVKLDDGGFSAGVAILTAGGALQRSLDVYIQDQTSDIIDLYVTRFINSLTLATTCLVDSLSITVTDASAVTAGNYISIQQDDRFYQGKILSKNVNVLNLDTPIDYPFTPSAGIQEKSRELNVDGSVTTQIANIRPLPGIVGDITRIIFVITDNVEMDDSKFGGIPALTKGIVLRRKNGHNHSIFNAKTNSDIIARCSSSNYSSKAPAGEFGFNAIREFNGQDRNGVVIRLDGSIGDELQILIQDNLTDLTSFHVIVQGHLVD